MKTIREDFFIPVHIYLLNHSVGLLPKISYEHMDDFFTLWKTKGSLAWDDWLLTIDAFCKTLSQLLNGNPDEFCPQVNISSAFSKILRSLPKRPLRNKIILSELDFPSIGFIAQQAARLGYKIEYIPSKYNNNLLDTWERYLSDDVQMAFITHVFSENNAQNPISEITALTAKKGIFSVVDIAQSAGIIPIDIKTWHADFIIGTSIKWLCGGSGAAFLWVDFNKINEFAPVGGGWFAHENPFEFDIHHFQYAKNALRFMDGTPSILPIHIANASIEKIIDIGVENIYHHNQALIHILLNAAKEYELPISSSASPLNRAGTLVLQFKNNIKAVQNLEKQNIMVDERPRFGVRFSPHIYNTEDEMKYVALELNM